ncbi:hypothetical protein [Klebsiella pneumoniae]
MTDITELTSVQKNANIHRLSRLIAYASNDELHQLAVEVEQYTDQLIEALEKAQQVDEELCKLLPPGAEYMAPPDGGDVTPLEGVRRMVADYRQRIAELESRTVKMPHRNLGHPKLFLLCPFPYYDAEDMEKALAAAGIRVEAE